MKKVGIIGITGKMGSAVHSAVQSDTLLTFSKGICSKSIDEDYHKMAQESDVIVDFSSNISTQKALEVCREHRVPFISGTTAIDGDCKNLMIEASKTIPLLHASNFCLTIHVLYDFVKTASNILKEYDVSIIDTHHKMKKDSPSGTALYLKEALGDKNAELLSRRCGNIVGEHEVSFFGTKDKLELTHVTYDRSVFAHGAVDIAKWILDKSPGYYSVKDYLGSFNE